MKVQILLLAFLVHAVAGQNDFCDMCGGKGSPANSALVIPFLAIGENQNPTCQQVFDFANTAVTSPDDVCSLIQSHKDFCGCPEAATSPINSCSLCPEGATPMNLNAKTPFEDTCSELDTYLRYLPADLCMTDRVSSVMRADAFCGCPGVTAECTMCSDGTNNLANPERKVPFYEFLGNSFSSTCQKLADFYTLYDTNDISTCEFVQIESKYCGCQSETDSGPVNACKICSDGTAPLKGDKFIPELQMSCDELESYLSYLPADQCGMPWIFDFQRFDYICGCANATAPCPICPDGSIEITNPDAIIPYLMIPNNENPTCQELATLGVTSDKDELVLQDCTIFEAQASFCGCAGVPKPETTCEFCPGGESPPDESLNTPFGDTCKELSDYLSYLPPDECNTERVEFIKRQDFLCGCPSATTSCALCANHESNDLQYTDRHIPLLSLSSDNSNPTCGEVVQFISVNDGDFSDASCSALQEYQGYCGCPASPVKNECSFCPNGGTISTPDKVVSDVFTCQDLEDFVSFLTVDQCISDDRDFKQIQAYAFVCGCPNVQPSCTLCPSGTISPSGSTRIDDEGVTCNEYAEYVLALTEGTCTVLRDEIQDYASVCGCGTPVAPPTGTPGIPPSPPRDNGSSSQSSSSSQKEPKKKNTTAIVITMAVLVPVVLALLTLIYYFFFYGRPKQLDSKILAEPDGTVNGGRPLPVENMEGSLSMSDIPIQSPRSPVPPPAESFSIDEEEDNENENENEASEVSDLEHKIV